MCRRYSELSSGAPESPSCSSGGVIKKERMGLHVESSKEFPRLDRHSVGRDLGEIDLPLSLPAVDTKQAARSDKCGFIHTIPKDAPAWL